MNYLNLSEDYLDIETKEKTLKEVENVVNQCFACDLGKTCNNKVFSDGKASAKIMLIGEAPGADEDAIGVPFVGRAGKFLTQMLSQVGLNREDDLYIVNTVKCRPPENRVPTDAEKASCKQFLMAQINIVKPKVIILCGATALKSFIDKDFKISQIRGQWIDIIDGVKAMAIFHPSYLLRNHSLEDGSPRVLTLKDLTAIRDFVG